MTKAHGLYFDGVLIPVEFLVNHRTILWDDIAREVTIYHIELETHDIILANGTPAETYRDDGKRWLFHNANTGWHLPPQQPCAPVLTGGPLVDAVWAPPARPRGSEPPPRSQTMPTFIYSRTAGRSRPTNGPAASTYSICPRCH